MNRIYRLVFNAALGQIQVAAEFANAQQRPATRSTHAGRLLPSLLATAVFAAMAPAVQAADLPTGFAPVQNSATMSQNGSAMIISQNGKVSLINWTGFDIAQGSSVTFDMPSTAAGSINIISGAASVINGSLSSVGNVFLVNTNGIVFNSGSTINVGGLLATSLPPIMSNLDVSASASLPAVWTFTGSGTPGAIVNRGNINAATGGVSLIGAIVENSGTITAAGTASLLAANSVNSIFMQPAAPSANDAGTWEHMLTAQSAGGVAASAINNTGYLSAASVDMKSMVQSGTFFFGINSTGVVQAQGIYGGSLEFRTNAPANIDFGTGTTAGSISSTSSALSARGTATAGSISLVSDNALDLAATLNSTNIALSGKQIGQTSGALRGAVTVNTTGDATLNSSSNAITRLGGKVDGNLRLTSTTDVGQTNTLLIGGTTTLTGMAGSDGSLAGFNFNNRGNQFGGTVSGGGGTLQLGSSGALRLGTFNVDNLAASGSAITLGGNVTSTGAQSYTGPVTLGSSMMLSSTSGGALSFSGTVDGAHALTVDTAGTRTFGGAVGSATALSSLQTLGTGSTVLNGNVTTSGAIGLSGNVRLGADVAITSSGNQTISLAGTVDSDGTARALTLDTDGLAILGGRLGGSSVLASLTRTGAGATQLGGSISTVGNIDLQGTLNATGAATLASTSGDIHVGGAILSTDALRLQGGDIVVDGTIAASSVAINGGTFDGAGIDSSGALTVTLTEGGLVQGGRYAAGGAATFDVADDITLDNPQNHFGGSVALKGGTVKLSSQGNLSLGDVDAQALAISSGGSISQSTATAINVDTTSSFTATNGITLGRGGNVFGGAVTLRAGGAAQVVADGTLRFGNIDVGSLSASGTTLYLPQNLVTQGAQSWSGALLLEGDTSLSSTLGGLSFYGTLNGPHALSIDAAAGTVHLGAISTIGSLSSITAAETQLAADITTRGDITLGNSRVNGDVVLASTGGSVSIAGALNGFTDDADTLAINAAGSAALQGTTGGDKRLHDLSLSGNTVSTAAVDVGNDLSIDSVASLTQTGRYRVGGNAAFNSLGNITLQNTANQFAGDVALSGNNVHITGLGALTVSGMAATTLLADAGALLTLRDATMAQSTALTGEAVRLDSVALGQTSTVTATGGNISQTGAVSVGGASTWTATGDIVLGDGTNQFGGAVSAAGTNITLSADSALNLGSVTTAGVAQLSGRGVHLGSVQVNSLQVQSSAGITQGNALALTGTAGFNATGDVVLDNVTNTFAAGVQLSGHDIRIDSARGLTLAGVNATGDLRATAHAGNLLQSAVVNVEGRSNLAASGNVQLDNLGNTFDGVIAAQGQSILLRADSDLEVESLRNGSNGAVQLVATGDIDLGGTAVNTGTNLLSLLSSAGQVRTATALTGSQVSITGVEGIRIGGDINANSLSLVSSRNNVEQQVGRIQSGTTLLGAGQGDLLLESTSNRFTGVTSLSGRDVRVAAGDLTLGMVHASRDLHLDSGGSIQQQAQMSVGRTADLRAIGDITLQHADNRLDGQVQIDGRDVQIHADARLNLQAVNARNMDARAGTSLVLDNAIVSGDATVQGQELQLGDSRIGGNLIATSLGTIQQTAALRITGTSQFQANGGIQLGQAGNHFGGRVDINAASASIRSAGSMQLGNITTTGNLQVGADAGLRLDGQIRAANVDLATAGVFDNRFGSSAIALTGQGRWQVYLASPFQNHVFGGLDSGNTAVWNSTAFTHATGSDNRYLFAWQPTLTVTANTLRKVYGDSIDPSNAFSITGAMAGVTGAYLADSVADLITGNPLLASTGASATAGVTATPYAIDVSGGTLDTGTSGYALSFVQGELWVDPKTLIITANNGGKTYGQTGGLNGFTSNGLVNGDSVSSVDLGSAGTAATATVGDYTISASNADGTGLSNYDITYIDGTLSIGKAGLTITANNGGKTYGQIGGLNGFSSNGLLNGNSVSSVDLGSNGSAATANVGNYTITASNADGTGLSNYDITYVDGTLKIGKAGLTITANNGGKTYGQTGGLAGFTSNGLVNGDSVSSVDLGSTGSAAIATVGDYTITASNADGTGLSNYDITYVDGTLKIGKAGLTITANNGGKTYGQTGGLAGFTSSGLVNGDSVSSVDLGSTGSAAIATVGDYTITASNADGTGLSNYDITYVDGTLKIGKAGLTITANNG
ncbi:MBG domain-containing protein, partial [Stenotrophomonas sp.]|uniref:MBG domain-containing protein n=1 Tax=Stenotrophomonas sp. TaxID=69392 RepID=UPI0028981537